MYLALNINASTPGKISPDRFFERIAIAIEITSSTISLTIKTFDKVYLKM
jgi:hypothetical protein